MPTDAQSGDMTLRPASSHELAGYSTRNTNEYHMKHQILLKPSPYIQLAHLYEHMACMYVTSALRSRGFYEYCDFDLVGKTYHGGLVALEYDRQSNAPNLESLLETVHITDAAIDIAFSQITAEKGQRLTVTNRASLNEAVESLNRTKWIPVDMFGTLDAQSTRRRSGLIQISDTEPKLHALKLSISLPLNALFGDRRLIPLFRQISHLIAVNLATLICDQFGGFAEENAFTVKKDQTFLSSQIWFTSNRFPNPAQLKETVIELLGQMRKYSAYERLTSQLASMSYSNHSDDTVSFERNYEDTLVFMGSKGWSEVATTVNLSNLLENTEIIFSQGRSEVLRCTIK